MSVYLFLLLEFFGTGLFAVGGGLATIPFLQSIGRRRGWYTAKKLADMIAAAQCVPGPLGTNLAAYTGLTVAGLFGAVLSVVSLMAPTVLVDLLVARLMERFKHTTRAERVMRVLRPVSAGLICAAALTLLQISLGSGAALDWHAPLRWFDWRCVALYAALLPFVFWKKTRKLHPLCYIAFGAAAGMLLGV
ncbi:MAG: chromate transporter [Oscillospiraceae bacterium]|jgi:chromate transporter|nr:chromate transporter [Oscillospiraceae bacterium]